MIAAGLAVLSGAWGRIAIVLAIVAALLGGYVLIRQSGRVAERAAAASKEIDDDQTASHARSAVDGLGDGAVSERLHQFQRQ